jgi:hypothetical protein
MINIDQRIRLMPRPSRNSTNNPELKEQTTLVFISLPDPCLAGQQLQPAACSWDAAEEPA